METEQAKQADRRVTYKTYISLFPSTWDKLYAEATKRHISGRELLQALLTQWGSQEDTAAPMPTKQAKTNRLAEELWTEEGEDLTGYQA